MSCHRNNMFDDTTFEFPRIGFWLIHVLGAFFLLLFGMRLAVRRMPLPIIAYRLLKASRR